MSNNIVFIGLDVEDNSFHGSALDPLTDETIQYRTHPTTLFQVSIPCFHTAEELAHSLGFTKAKAEIIVMKGTVIGLLDKERGRRGFNNTKFAEFLGIPRSRWSSIFSNPEKVTLDYLLTLAAKCGTLYKLTRKAE